MYSIIAIPALKDNYTWTIKEQSGSNCICIDPGEAEPVINYLEQSNYNLSAILITHHHYDHTNGINELFKKYSPSIYAPSTSIHQKATIVENSTTFTLPNILIDCEVTATPGHTLDHVIYKIQNHLFTGDTLFSVGCGKIFEGTFETMFNSLLKIRKMPNDTLVYCGHEYTYNNLLFAKAVTPNNQHVIKKMHQIYVAGRNAITLPSTIGEEKLINPFLRCSDSDIIQAIQAYAKKDLSTPLDVFKQLRIWKDNF